MMTWGKMKDEKAPEQPSQVEQIPVRRVKQLKQTIGVSPEQAQQSLDKSTVPGRKLTPEQIELVKVFVAWREKLTEYDPIDLYQMLSELLSTIIDMETSDLQDQLDKQLVGLNEVRAKTGLPPVNMDEED